MVEKRRILMQNFEGEANWSAVVNFHCMQMSLVTSMWFIFGDDEMTRHVHHAFLLFGNDVISLESSPLIFMYLHTRT